MLGKWRIAALAVSVGLSVCLAGADATAQSGSDVEAIHEDLRAVRDLLATSANAQDWDALAETIAPEGVVVTMTNDVLRGPEEVRAYMQMMMTGQSRLIDSMTVTSAEADELSRLYGDNTIAVATGNLDAHFELAVGKAFDWPIRWTAVLTRQGDRWLIANLHFSANAVENPIVAAKGMVLTWLPWVAGLLGLVAGYTLARIRRRSLTS